MEISTNQEEAKNSEDSNEKKTIMVVDDEENNLVILETYLNEAGYDVITAVNGQEAWDFIKIFGQDVSLILLDRMMPVMDGMQFLSYLKGHPKHSDIPVIMQTAAAQKDQVVEGMNSGVYYYLRKPFEEAKVLQLVSEAMQGKRNLRELKKRNYGQEDAVGNYCIDPSLYKNL